MTRRCKVGDRARIIGAGNDTGKIVVIVQRYRHGEWVADATWPTVLLPWVITSLSGPLECAFLDGSSAPSSMTVVMSDRNLVPIHDDDQDDQDIIERPVPTQGVAA